VCVCVCVCARERERERERDRKRIRVCMCMIIAFKSSPGTCAYASAQTSGCVGVWVRVCLCVHERE